MNNYSRLFGRLFVAGALLIGVLAASAFAGDWPMYRHDTQRSAATDEALTVPLQPAWVYRCAQPPAPAWPDPFHLVNRLDFDYAPALAIAEGIVCFGSSSDDTLRALDVKTGLEKWHFIAGGPIRFAPQIEKGKVYFAADDGVIYCLEAATGKVAWTFRGAPADERMAGQHRIISRWPIRTGVLVLDGVVYATAGMWHSEGIATYALAADTGRQLWCTDGGGAPQGPLLAGGDLLLIPSGNSGPMPLDRRTCKSVRWVGGGLPGAGGTWLTVDAGRMYSFAFHRSGILSIQPSVLTNGATGRAWGADVVPQLAIAPWKPNQIHSKGKVSALVHKGQPYARHAYGIALAGDRLVLGHENAVSVERSGRIIAAELRFGSAGDDIMVCATVNDPRVVQAKTPWEGSCVEVFGSLPGQATIKQVLLVPASSTDPASAYRAQDGQPVLAPEIRLQSTPSKAGYELVALIPRALLGMEPASAEVRLEAQVTVTGPDGTLQRDTLFGSTRAYQDNQRFETFTLRPNKPRLPLEQVKKTLAAVKGLPIVMRGASELWRAPVEGEARDLAVADGRLFAATHKGVIHCFAPGEGAGGNQNSGATSQELEPGTAGAEQSKIQNLKSKIARLLEQAGMDRGFALVVGDPEAQLSRMLAEETALRVVTVLTDDAAAQALRERLLAETTLYGSRIHVQTVERLDRLPFAQYFANAVIVAGASPVQGGPGAPRAASEAGLSGQELYRVLRPCGGVLLCPGLDAASTRQLMDSMRQAEAHEWDSWGRALSPKAPDLSQDGRLGEPSLPSDGTPSCFTRGKLPGALDWDTNTKEQATDQRVRWPLRRLWFGGPSTRQVQFAGEGAPGPVAAAGRYFMFSEAMLTAVDAYNGEVLWSRPLPRQTPREYAIGGLQFPVADLLPPGLGKADLFRGVRANDDAVYLQLGKAFFRGKSDAFIQLDARTGEQKKFYGLYLPPTNVSLKTPQTWPVEVDSNHSGVVRLEATDKGLVATLTTRDPDVTPQDAWELFFDLRSPEARYGLYERGMFQVRVVVAQTDKTLPSWSPGTGAIFPVIELSGARETNGTRTVAVFPWAELEKVAGAKPSDFGFAVTLNSHDGGGGRPIVRRHLFGDWAADGVNNGWAAVSVAGTPPAGDTAKPPAIVAGASNTLKDSAGLARGGRALNAGVLQEPGTHPLTGEPAPKIFGVAPLCGQSYFAGTLISDRGSICDLVENGGLHPVIGVKTGCTVPQLIALGLLIISEENGHCVCNYALRTSQALAPAERRLDEDWAAFYERDVDTLVRQAHLNFGAPGDRRDPAGHLWLGFPRQDNPQSPEDFPNADHPLPYPLGMRDAQTGLWFRRTIRPSVWVPLTVESTVAALDEGGPNPTSADRSSKFDVRSSEFGNETSNVQHRTSNIESEQDASAAAPLPAAAGFGVYRFSTDRVPIRGTDRPWLYGSGYRGIRQATLTLNHFKPLVATRAVAVPVVDGKLDEPLWWEPADATNTPPLLPYTGTCVLFRHDDRHLYVGVQRPAMTFRPARAVKMAGTSHGAFTDEPRAWKTGASKPDEPSPKDNWWRLIVSDRTGRKAVYLTVTPDGTRADALDSREGGVGLATNALNRAWNGAWESAVVAGTNGLSLEMAIPWATLESVGLGKDRLAINGLMIDPGIGTESLTYLGIGGYDRCSNFTPLGLDQPVPVETRSFTVRLHFAEPDADAKPGRRVFDVKLQGQPVLKAFDIVKEAGAPRTALVKEFKGVKAAESLTLECVPAAQDPTPENAPILNALELMEEGATPPAL